MARHGLDQVAFVSPFLVSQSGEFRKLWGGFAPKSSASFRELAISVLGSARPVGFFYEHVFPYVNSWWKVKEGT